ncbi:hypothetical protein B0T10DRAFT_595249 [Thelonectria olida]|uniref:Uncharacterized protein n=1 Tax=Thelonectria olida TaxID=1576542 RepID=A0A9P8W739_9HYPO|nr:hypothetical protein B0T10DRAFT_595249 [Thelonectria olida]
MSAELVGHGFNAGDVTLGMQLFPSSIRYEGLCSADWSLGNIQSGITAPLTANPACTLFQRRACVGASAAGWLRMHGRISRYISVHVFVMRERVSQSTATALCTGSVAGATGCCWKNCFSPTQVDTSTVGFPVHRVNYDPLSSFFFASYAPTYLRAARIAQETVESNSNNAIMNVADSALFKEYARPVLQTQQTTTRWSFLPLAVVGFVASVFGLGGTETSLSDTSEE